MFGRKKIKENVRPILVYKYRGGDDKTFERDLTSIENNFFWASSIGQLNDPCEGIATSNKLYSQIETLNKSSGENSKRAEANVKNKVERLLSNKDIGVYALSRTYDDELLWAHYSNSHYGFCIEYDFNLLVDSFKESEIFHFPIIYNNKPYDISINDIRNIRYDQSGIVQKIIGFKSNRWEYEKEYRIVTDSWGKHVYNYKAIKSIYFGLRMDGKHKEFIMRRLKGRGIKYFQMKLLPKSYDFYAEEVRDPNESEVTYLKYIPDFVITEKRVGFQVKERAYENLKRRGNIRIEIEVKISNLELRKFATFIKDHLFQGAKRINMFYDIKHQEDLGMAWATSHFDKDEIKVVINDFT